jgi:hypothetical protein
VPPVGCPSCGRVIEVGKTTRTAEGFCPTPGCDYPLFWATGALPEEDYTAPAEEVVHRRPGTGGREMPSAERCPVCREPNRVNAVFCQRCGADMHPAPAPPEPPPAPPAAPAPPGPPYVRPSPWSDWRVILVVLVLVVAFLLSATLVLVDRY